MLRYIIIFRRVHKINSITLKVLLLLYIFFNYLSKRVLFTKMVLISNKELFLVDFFYGNLKVGIYGT